MKYSRKFVAVKNKYKKYLLWF